MKMSAKVEIAVTLLAIIAVFSLFQSSLLNTVSIIILFRLLYRYSNINQPKGDTVASAATEQGIGVGTGMAKYQVTSYIMDNLCSVLISIELLSLPIMVLYLISRYQSFNCIVGLIVGVGFAMVMHPKIMKLMRVWVWFITFNLSLITIMVITALSR